MIRQTIWIIPPLLGAAFYAAGLKSSGNQHSLSGAERRIKEQMNLGRSAGEEKMTPEKLLQAVDEISARDLAKFMGGDSEDLKTAILQIRKTIERNLRNQLPFDRELENLLSRAAIQLGRVDRAQGLDWILDHVPDQRDQFMDGWAEIDPDGAFEAIVHSDLSNPCSLETLMNILQSYADQNPLLLKDACKRAPWQSFTNRDPFAPESFDVFTPGLPPGASVQPWLTSGTALDLKNEGFDMGPFLNQWMSENPRQALEQWKAGEGLMAGDPQENLGKMLTPHEDESTRPGIEDAIQRLSQEDQDHISDLLLNYATKHKSLESFREAYPYLIGDQDQKEDKP